MALSKLCFPTFNNNKDDFQDGKEVSSYDSILFCELNDKVAIAMPTSCLTAPLIEDGIVFSDNSWYNDYKYQIFNKNPKELFNFSNSIWLKIKDGKPWIGMTEEMFMVMMNFKPDIINTFTNSSGTLEQWVYGWDRYSSYYYFKNGILTSWQT